MNISRRVVVSILVAAIVLFLGLVFWPFILSDIIKPTALVVWLLLRILVLSVDQKYFWGAIVFLAVIFLFRLLPQEQVTIQSDNNTVANAAIRTIDYWRLLFMFNGQDIREEKSLRRELLHLIVSIYVSKQHNLTNFVVHDALKSGEIPLPKHIYDFLFPEETHKSKWSIKRAFRSIQLSIQKQIHQWTGQDKVEHRQMIDDILSFMETSLEIKNDE